MRAPNQQSPIIINEALPFVSIIIPAKNEGKILADCIDSILACNYPRDRYEIVLIDNGSTDNTVSIAKDRGAAVYLCPLLTIGAMRNHGANVSKGDIIAFIDADVIVTPNWLLSSVECLNRHSAAACVGSFPLVPENFGWVAKSWWQLQLPLIRGDEQQVRWIASMNMIWRKRVFQEIGGFSTDLTTGEDVDLCYRLGARYCILYCKGTLAYHHGEARDLKHLFKKERWRGRSNYEGIRYHGYKIDELPSLLIPFYYIMLFIAVLIAVIITNAFLLLGAFIMALLPPLAKASLSMDTPSPAFFIKMTICYLTYALARTFAAFDWIERILIRWNRLHSL
jgi:glycosyltransferase involved in cell wall biosynthesis